MKISPSLQILGFGIGSFVTYSLYCGNDRIYREYVMPALRFIIQDGEKAHNLALFAAKYHFLPHKSCGLFPNLRRNILGLEFDHPVGLSAGFDKNGDAFLGLLLSGFSHVEVGTVTPLPQPGNPKPRIFRWNEKEAIINRCGFNNDGHEAVYQRLKGRPWEGLGIVGVNLGCNKTSLDPINDYVLGVDKFGEIADYLVINVSSPNTAGLRSLQTKQKLIDLLKRVLSARSKLKKKTPILLKISPDETDETLVDIVHVCLDTKTRMDGLIVSNTTLATCEEASACGAADPVSETNSSFGGLSGRPLFEKSTVCLEKVAKLSKGQIPLIGVGGISDGADALKKLKAGACLVQLYSALAYQGFPVAHRIARELNEANDL